jgi:hypothetical protein
VAIRLTDPDPPLSSLSISCRSIGRRKPLIKTTDFQLGRTFSTAETTQSRRFGLEVIENALAKQPAKIIDFRGLADSCSQGIRAENPMGESRPDKPSWVSFSKPFGDHRFTR